MAVVFSIHGPILIWPCCIRLKQLVSPEECSFSLVVKISNLQFGGMPGCSDRPLVALEGEGTHHVLIQFHALVAYPARNELASPAEYPLVMSK